MEFMFGGGPQGTALMPIGSVRPCESWVFIIFQDYEIFFDALEGETLFSLLGVKPPQTEIEFILDDIKKNPTGHNKTPELSSESVSKYS